MEGVKGVGFFGIHWWGGIDKQRREMIPTRQASGLLVARVLVDVCMWTSPGLN